MSKENTDATTENVDQITTDHKSENTVPSYRLREEAEKRRTAEKELETYRNAEKERTDKDKSFEQKFNTLSGEFGAYKETVKQSNLKTELVGELTNLGFDRKIANLADSKDLTEDNLKDRVKAFTKDMKEYLPADTNDNKDKPVVNPLANIQPSSTPIQPGILGQKPDGTMSSAEVMKGLINKNA